MIPDETTLRQMADIERDRRLKALEEKLDETYGKALQANRKADITCLDLVEVRKRLTELEKPKSQLTTVNSEKSVNIEPKKTWQESLVEWILKNKK